MLNYRQETVLVRYEIDGCSSTVCNERILLVRNDALGDALVTLPTAEALREHFPNAEVTVLAGERGEWVFRRAGFTVLPDPVGFTKTVELLRDSRPSVIIVANPGGRIPLAALIAGVPIRIGYARRLWGFCYNRPLFASRRRSGAHEAARTLALLRPLGIRMRRIEPPRLEPPSEAVRKIGMLLDDAGIHRRYVVLHPGSGGSADQWPTGHHRELARLLLSEGYGIVVSGGEGEKIPAESVIAGLRGPCVNLAGRTDLDLLAALIAGACWFLSSSTGPMHLAAALGVPQVALFSHGAPINPARWRPLNPGARVLTPPKTGDGLDQIPPRAVADAILETPPDSRYTKPIRGAEAPQSR